MFLCFPEASGRGICHRLTIWLDLLLKERRMKVSVLKKHSVSLRYLSMMVCKFITASCSDLWSAIALAWAVARSSAFSSANHFTVALFSLCQTNSSRHCVSEEYLLVFYLRCCQLRSSFLKEARLMKQIFLAHKSHPMTRVRLK